MAQKLIAFALIAAFGCMAGTCATTKAPPARVSRLPALVPYSAEELNAINSERPKVKACCPNTDRAMTHYGKLRDKIHAAKKLETRR